MLVVPELLHGLHVRAPADRPICVRHIVSHAVSIEHIGYMSYCNDLVILYSVSSRQLRASRKPFMTQLIFYNNILCRTSTILLLRNERRGFISECTYTLVLMFTNNNIRYINYLLVVRLVLRHVGLTLNRAPKILNSEESRFSMENFLRHRYLGHCIQIVIGKFLF